MKRLDPMGALPGTGWILAGVEPCESLSDHSFGAAWLALLLVDALREDGVTVDGEAVLRMALVHDVAEVQTGDIPAPAKTPALRTALHEAEWKVVEGLLPEPERGAWVAVELGGSLEARVVRVADKLQMLIKALVYARLHGAPLVEAFFGGQEPFDDLGIGPAREVFELLVEEARRYRAAL